jgi:PAS domain-containing protein
MRAVIDPVPAMICQADAQLRIVYANQRYADWVGAPRDQLIGRPVRELVDAGPSGTGRTCGRCWGARSLRALPAYKRRRCATEAHPLPNTTRPGRVRILRC